MKSKSFAERIIADKYSHLSRKVKILTLSHYEIPHFLSVCNIGIYFFSGNVLRGRISYPIKIGEYLAAGLPVICNRAIGISNIIESENCGIVVEDLSKNTFLEAINRLKEILQDKNIQKRCRNLAETYFSLEKSIANLEECYKWVLER